MLLRTGKSLNIAFAGGAVALVLGVLSGQAMHPDLANRVDRPMGPQMFADWPGEGSTGPFDGGTTFAAYHGTPPDYVFGSDWKRAMNPPAEPSETAALTRVSYDEPADPPAAAPHADDPSLTPARDDTTVAVADPNNPARVPAYETETPADPAGARP